MHWNDEQLARAGERMVGLGARIVCAALEYDTLSIQGHPWSEILNRLRARESRFGARVIDALAASTGIGREPDEEVVLPLREAQPGMRLRQEIRTQNGALLVPVGFEISSRLLERISQVAAEVLEHKVRLAPARAKT